MQISTHSLVGGVPAQLRHPYYEPQATVQVTKEAFISGIEFRGKLCNVH